MKWFLLVILPCICGCAAAPVVAGFASGGVTLYKHANETGPKAELVLVKLEPHHDQLYLCCKCDHTCVGGK
jgi:hypothetical protein